MIFLSSGSPVGLDFPSNLSAGSPGPERFRNDLGLILGQDQNFHLQQLCTAATADLTVCNGRASLRLPFRRLSAKGLAPIEATPLGIFWWCEQDATCATHCFRSTPFTIACPQNPIFLLLRHVRRACFVVAFLFLSIAVTASWRTVGLSMTAAAT